MALATVVAVSFLALLYLSWRVFRAYLVRSSLDNIPGPPRGSFIAGNMRQIFAHDSWPFLRDLVDTYGPVSKLHGFLGAKWLHVYDPKAMHSIYLKDQEHYAREIGAGKLLFGPGLLSTLGPSHRKQRKMLTPVFSAAHMRNMTPFFYEITRKLQQAIETRVRRGAEDIDMVHWMGRTALELIGQGGLGHSFDPLIEDTEDAFTEAVKALVPAFVEINYIRIFVPYVEYLGPAWFRRKLLDLVPIKGLQRVKDIIDLLHSRSVEIYNAKKAAIERGDEALLHQVAEGKDIMSILLKANMMASEEDRLSDEEVLAQMSTFILAGVDTTSNALSRVLHILAEHTEVQEKLRGELLEAHERLGGDIPYDELTQLPYLDAVCRETLRLYAPVNLSSRVAKEDTVLPISEPLRARDGTVMHEIPVQKGTAIFLNLPACNTYKALWGEDAREWKPERWLKPLPRAVEEARIPGIYANLMTFISGGHSCIGFKFSQLEMKIVLAVLITSFRFTPSKKPIVWNFAGITFPAADKNSSTAEMHLKVELVSV